jgi:sugar-specific transcriptional regulator TrmB
LEFQTSEVQTLINLGLTGTQAKIYLSLAMFGPSSIAATAKKSKLTKLDTFRTLVKLEKEGLVEKIVKSPTQTLFKAISADRTLKTLRNKKNQPKSTFESVILNLKGKQQKLNSFEVIHQKEAITQRINLAVNQAEKSIDLIASWNAFSEAYQVIPEKNVPNVSRRYIIEQPPKNKPFNLIREYNNDICALRYIQTSPKSELVIFDKKEVIIIDFKGSDVDNSQALWTNNKSMMLMAQNFFDNLWQEATQKPVLKKPF